MELKRRTAIITGSARGIGREGVVNGLTTDSWTETIKKVEDAGGKAIADVSKAAD